ncbi:hypothetical protein ABT56_00315 [Photobacterium aquae]|uniref:Uncharacterized protein n=1 Tax=Photobacterium aquae TaxID=1195763 RepID=A0A0J1HD57_9GAMM|nr:hypothetical protein [Photobacterium aquae]KLV09568.1 hypothetical protein ABT56_00315 [Photobacterium aquae]
MAYQMEICDSPEDLHRAFAAFLGAHPALPWQLRDGNANSLCKAVVENTEIGLALGWNAIPNSYKKGIDFYLGEAYAGGPWPGLLNAKCVWQNWSGGRIVWPSAFHFIAGQEYFIVTVMNPNTGECLNYGGGTAVGIGSEHHGIRGKWAAADWFDHNVGFFGAFLGGKKRHHERAYVNNWYMDSGSGHWQPVGGGDPALLPPLLGVWGKNSFYGEGVHDPYEIEKFVFRQSATTVFLPCVMGKMNNGWRPAVDIPYIRFCSMALLSTGDQIDYQGKNWRAFSRCNHQDAEIGFVVLEDDI